MGSFEQRSDQELLERTTHEPEAFGAFYRRHAEDMLAYFRRRTGDSQLALDLTAETFARALQHTDSYRAMAQPPGAWLYTIARNLLTDSYRRGHVADDARRRLALEPMIVTELGFERVEAAAHAASQLATVDLDDALSPDQAGPFAPACSKTSPTNKSPSSCAAHSRSPDSTSREDYATSNDAGRNKHDHR